MSTNSQLCSSVVISSDGLALIELQEPIRTIVETQVLQRLVQALDNVLPAETAGVASVFALGAKEDLGSDDNVATVLLVSFHPFE